MTVDQLGRLRLAPGWKAAVVNEAPLAVGPWRTFSFGLDLRLQLAPETWAPTRVDTQGLREENVETLLLLNLDRLYPEYGMALCGKTLRDWAGADVEATDPSGCRHLFEVKFGAPANHVVDQALSYALDVVGQVGAGGQHFHEQPAEHQLRFTACRIAGFWTGTRADKWRRNQKLPPAERDWAALDRILGESPVPGLDPGSCRSLAAGLLASRPGVADLPERPSAVHFHLVVPDPAKISSDQIYALARLRWRGHRASVWQVAAETEGERGRLTVREVWVPPTDTSRKSWWVPEGCGPSATRVAAVYAAACTQDPALARELPPPQHGRSEVLAFGHAWYGRFPGFSLQVVKDDAGKDWLRMEVLVTNPPSLDAIHGTAAARIRHLRHETIAEWVAGVAPPRDEQIRREVRSLRRAPHEWATRDSSTGTELRCWHSGGLKSARVDIELGTGNHTAAVVARAIRALLSESAERAEGFGPDVVPL